MGSRPTHGGQMPSQKKTSHTPELQLVKSLTTDLTVRVRFPLGAFLLVRMSLGTHSLLRAERNGCGYCRT